MSMIQKGEISFFPWGFIGWILCVIGATVSSMPQWFIVTAPRGTGSAITAEAIGLPILFIGAILLIIGWLPESRRKYPEILENTLTPIPDYYLKQEGS
jgi:hypothetical protein